MKSDAFEKSAGMTGYEIIPFFNIDAISDGVLLTVSILYDFTYRDSLSLFSANEVSVVRSESIESLSFKVFSNLI